MENTRWCEEFINDISRESDEYFLMLTITPNSQSPILYEVIHGEVKHCNQLTPQLFKKYLDAFKTVKEPGVHIFRYQNHVLTETKWISHYNVELFDSSACELILFQEYGLYPEEIRKRKN